jgi:hypothetical protein
MLLLYDNSKVWQKMSPEEMQKATEKYMAWSKKPFTTGGKRLEESTGKVMKPHAGAHPTITDGPYGETKEVIGGFYLIEAANYDEAIQRTMDHPHLEYNGTVEVRQVYGS